MRTVYRYFLIAVVVSFPFTVAAQPQLNFKRVTNNWPTIELYFTVGCQGQPVWLTDKSAVTVTENGAPIHDFTLFCPDQTFDCRLSTALVFDASGSMQGAGNAGAKAGGNAFVDLMDGIADEAAVLWFNSWPTLAQPMTIYKDLLHNAINALPASGTTAAWDGIYSGVLEIINNGVNECRAVVALTDGGDASSSRSPQEIISLANRNGVRVFTIGLGSGVSSGTLQNIAELTGGRYYQTANPADLPAIYREIFVILAEGFQECSIKYQASCLDGGTRNVDLSVKNICAGSDKKTKTYRALKDTTTYMSVALGFQSHTLRSHSTMAMPLELFTPIPDGSIFYGSTFTVRFDENVVRCTGARTPPGSLLENVPITITSIPGGVTVQTLDRKYLPSAPAPSLLAELLFTPVGSPSDTTCTPVQLTSWIFEAGCFRPALMSGRLCFTSGYPDVTCTTSGPAALDWSLPLGKHLPDSIQVSAHLQNAGLKNAVNTRVVIGYNSADLLRLSPATDTIVVTPSTLPPNGQATATWIMQARPRSDTGSTRITFTTLYDDGLPRQCTHDISIPKSEYDVGCQLIAPALTANLQTKKYTPDPAPVQAVVRNTMATLQDRLTVELLLPADISFVAPDNPGTARKQLTPAVLDPGQTGSALWFVRSAEQPIDTRRTLECVTRRDTVEICRSTVEMLIPGVTGPPAPVITPLGSLRLCPGGSVELDAGDGYSSYLWSTGERTRTIVVRSAGSYLVTVTDQYGRRGTATPVVVAMVPAPRPYISPQRRPHIICEGEYAALDAGSYAEYLWNTGEVTRTITVRTSGSWWVRVKSAEGCYGYSDTAMSTVVPLPVKPTITRSGDTLTTQRYQTYQWYKDGGRMTGAVQQSFVATSKGAYQVRVTNEYGCTSASDIIDLVLTGFEGVPAPNTISLEVYPNPVTNELTVTLRGTADNPADIRLVSVLGQTITGTTSRKAHGEQIVTYDLSSHPAGLYFVTAAVQGRVLSRSVVKR
ncbi:MAG: VWA domain-containing protein [Ignavibacteriae bacterium]|nr:VWA domain-containing protein [Ignavibacteriota bacterium]